ncbi:MAG: hypothetical protein AAGA60_13185 [Cyanobacteria bacterium P01_E01_bin.42]
MALDNFDFSKAIATLLGGDYERDREIGMGNPEIASRIVEMLRENAGRIRKWFTMGMISLARGDRIDDANRYYEDCSRAYP